MIGLGLSLTGQRTSASLASLLFGLNEPGFTFEPSDITTLYQDRAGTTPVTAAGQSVGLRLDKSQGLRQGPELVTNGDFSAGSTGWWVPAGWSISSGTAVASVTNASLLSFSNVTAGRSYRVEFDVVSYTSGTLYVRVGAGAAATASSSGRKSFILTATTTAGVEFYGGAITATIDNISVRELAGNHQTAINDSARGIYGWMPKTGRRNLLTFTKQFNVWTKEGVTVAANPAVAPDSTTTADLLAETATTVTHAISQTVSTLSAAQHVFSVYLKKGSGATAPDWVQLCFGGVSASYANFNLSTGVVGVTSTATAAISSVGNGWYRCSLIISVATAGAASVQVVFTNNTDSATRRPSYAGATTSDVLLWGAQLETGSTATAYQRVVSQYDITEAGVPTCYYVQADGVDDAYVTPTITPGTDKVQVFAGVRKLSDAAFGLIAELSADVNSNNGSFNLSVSPPNVTRATYGATSCGSILAFLPTPPNYAAPLTNVVTGTGDISGDRVTLRVNGTQVATSALDQGTGNYLAYPVYIYSRGGTANPFNGLDFGHAVRFGPNLDAATIARVESLIARNTPEVTL